MKTSINSQLINIVSIFLFPVFTATFTSCEKNELDGIKVEAQTTQELNSNNESIKDTVKQVRELRCRTDDGRDCPALSDGSAEKRETDFELPEMVDGKPDRALEIRKRRRVASNVNQELILVY